MLLRWFCHINLNKDNATEPRTKKIKIRKVKYLNNIIEQDHQRIKRRIRIMTGFKEFESAQRTLSGIEVVSIIKKDQIINPCSTSFKTFCSLVV